MRTTNPDPLRVALYMRVSTDEQAKSGYSIPDQRRTLPDHAQREGWRVVEEIADDGYSGAFPDRPGIRRIYELAEAGEIDAVLATKRDRYFRSRLYRLEMDRDMKDHGVKLMALNDTGNPIGDGVQDDFAEWEREQTAERTRRGKLEKARKGLVVGGHNRAYGFDWVRDASGNTVGYAANPAEMATVRRIFSEVAAGTGIRTIKERLDAERVPRPGWGKTWSRPMLRNMLLNDLYRPHSVEESRGLGVSEEVAATLDPDARHGVYWYEGVPVPVDLTGSGLDRATVDAARHRVKGNRSPSRAANRFWELSGGILRCEECGRAMQTHSPHAAAGYLYYRCQCLAAGRADTCIMREMVRADRIEPEVWEAVRRVMDDRHYVLDRLGEHFAEKRRELSRPAADAVTLARRLEGIEESRAKLQRAYMANALTLADLKARNAELDADRKLTERELERVRNREEELGKLAMAEAEARERISAGYGGLDDATPEKRREVYEDLRLRVEIGLEKRPRLFGIFPIGRGEDGTHHLMLSGFKTSSTRGGPSRRP